jgi:hypothetical protein
MRFTSVESGNVQFDQKYLERPSAGTLERQVRDNSHERCRSMTRRSSPELGNMRVGARIMKIEDWIPGIQKDRETSCEMT